ncbi:sugar phosphate nucleotidyltransferase [Paenibacillus xylaniclasticus]|uniref:sugar phosphate nucleotidyltransferase n=1 Tax=Paenibacillus xylaniclasticus TaxID=588083 RepID=UPI000FD84E1A|nr:MULTISPECIES: sugar phosphate nucleotidyltransferase [Paenibacillus]
MKIILLSGGSGKRLWPLSNDSRSKQFLKLLSNQSGDHVSMVQRVWGQLGNNDLSQHAYIATGRGQLEVIQSQLGLESNIIIEPERRDTFPAIALSAVYLHSVKQVSLEEVVAILPVDPYVEDHFFEKVKELAAIIDDSDANIGLLGVTPTYPSAKYGYIVPQSVGEQVYKQVSRFEEKPSESRAKELIAEHALWNCGVFAFRLGYMIEELTKRGLPVQYKELQAQYGSMKKISFDYEIVEKADKVVVLPYNGYWKDLGTWNTLTEEMGSPLIGNAIMSEDCVNTHVINELDIPITVLGVSNVVVAASPDGILVSDKASSPRIKDVLKHQDQRPMYEERRWGRYRVLDYIKYPGREEVLTKRILISEGCNLSYQYHMRRREVWTIVAGSGEMVLDGQLRPVQAGDIVVVPCEMKHSIRAITDLEIIEVQTGQELVEEDIVRLALNWDEIVELAVQLN